MMNIRRREFLKLLGATTVATTLPGCVPRKPQSLIPYVIPHEEIIPGRSVWYASVCRECPAGCGVKVRVREGRATKIEGNPFHPVNRGALCARGQAALQTLYNPDRIQTPLRKSPSGKWIPVSWTEAEDFLVSALKEIVGSGRGADVVWVTPHVTGSIDALVDAWLAALGSKRRYRCEAIGYEALKRANDLTFGIPAIPTFDFGQARTVFSFGADFLETWISPVCFAGGFSYLRGGDGARRSRCTYFGPRLSLTAANADTWVPVHPDMLGDLALSIVHVIVRDRLANGSTGDSRERTWPLVQDFPPSRVAGNAGMTEERILDLARELARSPASLAVAGGPAVDGESGVRTAVAVNLLNFVCGNIGTTVRFKPESTLSRVNTYASVTDLVKMMEKNQVPAIFLNEVNPLFTTPAGAGFAQALAKVPLVVSCSSLMDESASTATLVLPVHTPLESWGDFEPCEGVHGLLQPAMEPVFPTKMLGDILLETGRRMSPGPAFTSPTFHDYVKEHWKGIHKRIGTATPFEEFWIESLARGGAWKETAAPTPILAPALKPGVITRSPDISAREGKSLELLVYPTVSHFDGRGANNPWLEELPDPMSRITWGSWLEMSKSDGNALGVSTGDMVRVSSAHASVEVPALLTGGIMPGIVAVPLGRGHVHAGRYADGIGVNPVDLLAPIPSPDGSGGLQWFGTRVEVIRTNTTARLALLQHADMQHGRHIARETHPARTGGESEDGIHTPPSLYPEQQYRKHRWGMVVDLDRCTGCGACVVACYAENNIPVVGAEEVTKGRGMPWIRVDRYLDEEEVSAGATIGARFVPVLCQQCGDAPCETVCPVYAAYHTEEGLNGQVYNRCIGTRYCANNCPYKVRRFNWFGHDWPEPLNWQLNPDVTVRSRGVMEKCTFCIQRIVEAKNTARREQREVKDGEVTVACQQTCPAQAVTFGDLNDPGSAARIAGASPRAYHILEELNTRPAVTYLKKIKV